MNQYTPKSGLTVLFAAVVILFVTQVALTWLDTQTQHAFSTQYQLSHANLSGPLDTLDVLISEMRHDIMGIRNDADKKQLFRKVRSADSAYQELLQNAAKLEQTDSIPNQMKQHQMKNMQSSLKEVIARNDLSYQFSVSRAEQSLKKQSDWLNTYRNVEFRKLTKHVDDFQSQLSHFQSIELYFNSLIGVLTLLLFIFFIRKQNEYEQAQFEQHKQSFNKQDHIKALEQRILVANKTNQQQADELNRAKRNISMNTRYATVGRLIYPYQKQLKKILSGALGSLYILQKNNIKDKKSILEIDKIIKQGLSAIELTKIVSRLSDPNEQNQQSINVNTLIKDLHPLIQKIIHQQVKVDLVLSKEPLFVTVVVSKMIQAILNLIENANDSMPYGGRITIETVYELDQNRDQWAHITIKDTGKGIEQEIANSIFKVGYSTKESSSAIGFGLAKVVEIMAEFKGKIELNSQPGKGSEFKLLMPCSESKSSYLNSVTHRFISQPELLDSKKFLVIHSVKKVYSAIQQSLTKFGSLVEHLSSHKEVSKVIKNIHDYDVIFIEIKIEKSNGLETYLTIKENNPHTKIIFIGEAADGEMFISMADEEQCGYIRASSTEPTVLAEIAKMMAI